jgi:O-antigen ligase
MYFWNISKLKERLIDKPLDDREILPYVIIFSLLLSLVFCIPPEKENMWDTVGNILSLIIAIPGTIFVYQMNGGKKSEYFLQRYLVVGWVVAIRMGCLLIAALAFILIYDLYFINSLSMKTSWYAALTYFIYEILVYYRTGIHLKYIVEHRTEGQQHA